MKLSIVLLVLLLVGGSAYYLFEYKPQQTDGLLQEEVTETVPEVASQEGVSMDFWIDTYASTIAIITDNLLGTWQSTNDTQVIYQFKEDGVVIEQRDEQTQTGSWEVYKAQHPGDVEAASTVFVVIYFESLETSGEGGMLDFKIEELTKNNLKVTRYGKSTEFIRVHD